MQFRAVRSVASAVGLAVIAPTMLAGCGVGAPPKDFALGDAVLAMRVQGDGKDSSHLVLVSPGGRTRSVELDGIGEDAGVSWTDHGITVSDPSHDYLINKSGLIANERVSGGEELEASSEWYRVPVGDGTLIGFSPADSAKDAFVTYVDGASGKATSRVASHGETSTAAVCADRVFASGRGTSTKAFEDDSESIPESQKNRAALTSTYPHDGQDMLSNLAPSDSPGMTSPCVDGMVYELSQEGMAERAYVRAWNTTAGTPTAEVATDHEIIYPKGVESSGMPSDPAVVDGRLVWIDDHTMWSAPLPSDSSGSIKARDDGPVEGNLGLASEGAVFTSDAVYTVTDETELYEHSWRGGSHHRVWTELTGMALLRKDIASGEVSVPLGVDVTDVDYPTKDTYVRALAINPEWQP